MAATVLYFRTKYGRNSDLTTSTAQGLIKKIIETKLVVLRVWSSFNKSFNTNHLSCTRECYWVSMVINSSSWSRIGYFAKLSVVYSHKRFVFSSFQSAIDPRILRRLATYKRREFVEWIKEQKKNHLPRWGSLSSCWTN